MNPSAASSLLAWYDRHRRILPWRAMPGMPSDPYAVWLSEIMLQQTTVATVTAYFGRFMAQWPTVRDLAEAPLDDVLHAWQGLGYYARARNLHACAKKIAKEYGGRFPADEAMLLRLPGIGRYTAAAIAAIAFDRPANVVDGNVERVMARLFAVEANLPAAKPVLAAHAQSLVPRRRVGDYAQAVMDLGATICTPRKPRCLACPWIGRCAASAAGQPERYPVKRPKPTRPVRYGTVFWISRGDGAVLMRRRAESGLLGGLMEFPSTAWLAAQAANPVEQAPTAANGWRQLQGEVRHVFTHFELRLSILAGATRLRDPPGLWVKPKDFGLYALPTLMKKVASLASGQ